MPTDIYSSVTSISRPWIELSRLNKPAGALLMIWPYVWGLAMAASNVKLPVLSFLKYLVVGCSWFFVLRGFVPILKVVIAQDINRLLGAGCVWNDIVDRDIDRRVERTKHRPIAAGKISVAGALIFLAVNLALLSAVLALGNHQLRLLGLATIFPLSGSYPFMKRLSYWPQAWLGIAINTGTVMAWSGTAGDVPRSAIFLAAATWFWTMWYDTIYGNQDKKDDVNVGIGSTALLFKSSLISRLFLAFHALGFIACLAISGILNHQSVPYYSIGVFVPAINIISQFLRVDLDSPKSCWEVFCENGFVIGPIITVGLVTDYLYQSLYY